MCTIGFLTSKQQFLIIGISHFKLRGCGGEILSLLLTRELQLGRLFCGKVYVSVSQGIENFVNWAHVARKVLAGISTTSS